MKSTKSETKIPYVGQKATLLVDYDLRLQKDEVYKIARVSLDGYMVAIEHPLRRTDVWFTRSEVSL